MLTLTVSLKKGLRAGGENPSVSVKKSIVFSVKFNILSIKTYLERNVLLSGLPVAFDVSGITLLRGICIHNLDPKSGSNCEFR